MQHELRVGLVINPIAGIGGPVALHGSDTRAIQEEALRRGATSVVQSRVEAAFKACKQLNNIKVVTCKGEMGVEVLSGVDLSPEVINIHPRLPTSREDTQAVARALIAENIDLLLFAGGDGTARDIMDIAGAQLSLGIPCGVKMHSGVFAITPGHVGELLDALVTGGLVSSSFADVRDVDEAMLRAGRISSSFYGELKVPSIGSYLQHTKIGGMEDARLAVEEIAADVCERIEGSTQGFLLGPGSTLMAIKNRLNIEGTLLGFDFVQGSEVVLDLTEKELYKRTSNMPWNLVVSFTRSQGFLFGRGNQQVSARVLAGLKSENLSIVSTREKLKTLEGRSLLVDTGNDEVNNKFNGLHELITGFEDRLLYRVGYER
jgi:predicted polyphosphate/ATP-dependent NAD kinase